MRGTLFLLFVSASAFAQSDIKVLDNKDCENAQRINEATSTIFTTTGGGGEIQEVAQKNKEEFNYFPTEQNVAWYSFVFPEEGKLTFLIKPLDPSTEVDFMLFESKEDNTCEQIENRNIKPIRSNQAFNDNKFEGQTGLGEFSHMSFAPKDYGNNLCKKLTASRGDEFYLAVNITEQEKMAHQLIFDFLSTNPAPIKKEITASDEETTITTTTEIVSAKKGEAAVTVKVIDAIEGAPVNATIELSGLTPGEPLIVENKNSYTYILEKKKQYTVKCVYEGYMLYTKQFTAPEDQKKMELDIELQPIEVGAKMVLENIRFKPDGAYMLSSSEPEITALLEFLEKNPETKIQINGHVNAPRMDNTFEMTKLSKERAEAVFNWLALKGILKSRMKYKGLGNSEMIYPVPNNYSQERANRRVEIEILK